MIRIHQNRCGYTGYTCNGISKLSSAFTGRALVCDPLMNRVANFDTTTSGEDVCEFKSSLESPITWNQFAAIGNAFQVAYPELPVFGSVAYMFDTTESAEAGQALMDWTVACAENDFNPWADWSDYWTGGGFLDTIHLVFGNWVRDGIETYWPQGRTDYMVSLQQTCLQWLDCTADSVNHANFIDNYLNLPTKFKGIMVSWNPVKTMDDPNLPIAETECIDNTDPFSLGGFLDLFGRVYTTLIDARAYESSWYVPLISGLVCFKVNNVEGVFEPGILEPMIATDFKPVSVPAITDWDAKLDGVLLPAVQITQWRNIVETWLNDIGAAIAHIWGLRDVFYTMYTGPYGQNFIIEATSGNPISWTGQDPSDVHEPRYKVSGGTVTVNGVTKNVAGLNNQAPPFYVYVNFAFVNCDQTTGQYGDVNVTLGTSAGGNFSVGIGGVFDITPARKQGIPQYTLYRIIQERFTVNVDIIRTCTEGFMFRLLSGASPYRALDYAPCDNSNQS